jgi:Zn-dependent protease with chaperone function
MDNQNISSKWLIMQGVWFGNLFALFASFLFAVADGIAIEVNGIKLGITQSFSLDYPFLGITLAIGFILAIFPASLGGVVLALIISKNHGEYLAPKKAFGIGLLLGGFSGFIISVLITFMALIIAWSHGADLTAFLIRSIEVTILSSLAGGFTGLCLVSQWKKKISFNTTLSQ